MPSVATATTLTSQLTTWATLDPQGTAVSFLDYDTAANGSQLSLTWLELDRRVAAVAVSLRTQVNRGEPVAVLVDQSLDYVVAFLAVLRAGAVAVPLFAPDLPGHADRLATVLADCRPPLVLTTRAGEQAVRDFLTERGLDPTAVSTVDDVSIDLADQFEEVRLDADDLAYLQYTSGSTGSARGVMITHGNVVANARQCATAYEMLRGHAVTVGWLPLFHDLGLVLTIAVPMVAGIRSVFMRPMAFLERPVRWVRALSANPGAVTAAPNFAYAYCASKVAEADKPRLRLESVHAMVDGSEPLQLAAIARFADTFAECGLRPGAHRPSYGLAEGTVAVTTTVAGTLPLARSFDRSALATGLLAELPSGSTGTVEMVACGRPMGQSVLIVDPVTHRELPDATVGEIWVTGSNVGAGYWNRPEESTATFGAVLAGGHEDDTWLRTGDLGAFHEGDLFVTGRIKDLIIVDGRNHYPQDIEQTVERGHEAIRPRNTVAFSVPTPDGERAVVLAERARSLSAESVDLTALLASVRAAVARRHGLALHDVRLVEPDSLARTSSGKIARSTCRARYLAE
ncbi:Acyl-CoA synthetase (AMP-forming)/AMP-acid ligase II [Actinokineospora alba]|uniref:Acyl-CoA synthetase (AMP-forming)/AMP-acid ligase II n=1 Tax=Actinokineospora alba TaxID=504798 RepID=A0A1H0LYW6_9PSEU|nr:fatty acyl-AMP ligase [Actinokineospora alba]TDP67516.1 acyl-CoA synthetase (AMP-forming)/AMP-acid ligase II [Actinokineospora alba]SDI46609.1 Acyl-CoA synthetase (AMP-forming)/AMP-acid ligase II [Actinokineospora alba]SDO73419.1 Acyl-CoA synthetase (AMP-forming)/AMP-acid ligase II [Actinokineospora alba]